MHILLVYVPVLSIFKFSLEVVNTCPWCILYLQFCILVPNTFYHVVQNGTICNIGAPCNYYFMSAIVMIDIQSLIKFLTCVQSILEQTVPTADN